MVNDMKDFGIRLRSLREKRNISQVTLSTHLGMAQESLSSYERQKTNPSIDVLKDIADFFNVSADYLLGLDDQELRIQERSLNSFEISLLRNYRMLAQTEKELLVKISADMADLYKQKR